MSYLIDTNVLSELRRKQPDPGVVEWFARHPARSLYLSVLALGEIRKGIEGVADATRRQALLDWLETELPAFFAERLIAVDAAVADRWGRRRALLWGACRAPGAWQQPSAPAAQQQRPSGSPSRTGGNTWDAQAWRQA